MVADPARHGPSLRSGLLERKTPALKVTHEFTRMLLGVGLITAHALRQPAAHATSRGSQQWNVRPSYE
jgi:hypothetical protein